MIRTILSLFSLLLLLLVFLVTPEIASAQKAKTLPFPSVFPSPVAVINSNELFWPLAAGKTMDDSLYFLKTFKENVRGWLIFGNSQKADYEVFLATKRLLEVEKLMGENKTDFANQTANSASIHLDRAEGKLQNAKSSGDDLNTFVSSAKPRLENIEKFSQSLKTKASGDLKNRLEQIDNKAKEDASLF